MNHKKHAILNVHFDTDVNCFTSEPGSFKTTISSYDIYDVHKLSLALCLLHSFSFPLKLMLCWTFHKLGRRQQRL